MNTVALSRNPSRLTAARNAVARLVNPTFRWLRRSMKVGKDRRVLQTVPAYLLADMGLERMEIRTTLGNHEVWLKNRR